MCAYVFVYGTPLTYSHARKRVIHWLDHFSNAKTESHGEFVHFYLVVQNENETEHWLSIPKKYGMHLPFVVSRQLKSFHSYWQLHHWSILLSYFCLLLLCTSLRHISNENANPTTISLHRNVEHLMCYFFFPSIIFVRFQRFNNTLRFRVMAR